MGVWTPARVLSLTEEEIVPGETLSEGGVRRELNKGEQRGQGGKGEGKQAALRKWIK